ncbi:MAG: exonuclease SbcCD subunit D [Parabacteroides sp.]
MKIIHTSDWHLGQELFTYDRTEEQQAFLEQLREIVREEQPDALVISGDIYHTSTPSNATMRLFTDGLDRIRLACPTMQIVVTAGNHDSSSRLEVTRVLWDHLRVSVVGRIARTDSGIAWDRHVIPVSRPDGEIKGWIVAMPHVFPQNYPALEENTPREERPTRFFEALGRQLEAVNQPRKPVVMMAHLAIAGSDTTGHDESRGGMDYMELQQLDAIAYDYLALGHIHCPQNLHGSRARYCGTPLPVSFDENYPHSVTVVEMERPGEAPRLRVCPIHNPWPLKVWPKEAVEIDEALKLLETIPDDERMYLCLHVRRRDVIPSYATERAFAATAGKRCRFCRFKWDEEKTHDRTVAPQLDLEQIQSLSPVQVADLFYQDNYGEVMDERLRLLLEQTVEEVRQIEKG